ncbi:DUF1833 family protein [Chelativorans sp. AA-79]|uniref:DUF1833 family protein n=1 Tax=Chelativorans sp. AA-79 TaxID=3028735 RepID=UPI0023F779A2|nr:DUF1833 family protein [Chelativorans sp. AA-79]WEX07367.1 DUF1833 family protein [Chelativorans sp. AA-79]
MSRTVSNTFRKALYARETDEVAVCLMTVTHPELSEPIRLSTDPTQRISIDPMIYGTVSRGENFPFVPINVVLSEDSDDTAPTASLEIDNTDLSLIAAMRSITQAAKVKLEMVLASDPDTVEIEFPEMMVSAVTYNASIISFTLTVDGLVAEPFPGNAFLPSTFPGLF